MNDEDEDDSHAVLGYGPPDDMVAVMFWAIVIASFIGVLGAIVFYCLSYFLILPLINDHLFHISEPIIPYISLLISLFPILVVSGYIVAFGVKLEKSS